MADITQTAANVRPGTDAARTQKTAGETISAGMPVYLKAADGLYYKADANAGAAESTVEGIALTNAAVNEEIVLQTSGDINLGATLTVGQIYILSGNVGAIAPASDLASGWYPVVLGIAKSTSLMVMGIQVGTVAKA